MIKFINKVTGGDMWVHETRIEEYLKAGHTMAPPPPLPEPKKKTTKAKK